MRLLTFRVDTAFTQTKTGPAGQLSGIVAPFGVTARRFGTAIQFAPGSLRVPEDLSTVKLLIEHDPDRPVGYATAAAETDAGLNMTFQLGDHARAADLADEAAQLLRDGFSVGMELDDAVFDQIADRTWGDSTSTDPITLAGDLREVSAVSVPQFNDARQSRAAAQLVTFSVPAPGGIMPTISTPAAAGSVTPAAAAGDPPTPSPTFGRFDPGTITPPAAPTLEELTAAVTERLGGRVERGVHPLARFSSFAEYAAAVRDDPTLQLALVDQITTDNPGLVRPGWLTEVVGAIDEGSPVVTALRAGGLPAGGMSFDWPVYTGDYKTLVAKQLTEKSEIHSAKVSFGKSAAVPIETFAGGSDISYQLLRRSSPSYLAEYNRIMALAYAWCIEDVYSDALTAAAGGTVVCDPLTAPAADIRAALFEASSKVRTATGRPADEVFVSPDVFAAWGALTGLENPAYGTVNAHGTASAATLSININGLAIIEGPALAAATALVTNDAAAAVYADGPFTATAEDVNKLGQNVAIWGMAAFAAKRPTGIVKFSATVADEPAGRSAKK
jgi:hypothetical protein